MKPRILQITLSFLLPVFFIVGCDKQKTQNGQTEYEIDKSQTKGEFSLRVKSLKRDYALWETVELIVQTSCNTEISSLASIVEKVQDFKILFKEKLDDTFDDRGNIVRTTKFVLEPMKQGDIKIDTISAKFGDNQDIIAESVVIDIQSQIKTNDSNSGPADIESVVNLPFRISMAGWIIIAVIFAAIIVIIVYAITRRKKLPGKLLIIKRADQTALERIDQLLLQGLIEKGLLEEFYGRLCNILRYYIEDRFNVKAAEMTTEEFLQEISAGNILDSQDRLNLESFLMDCDLVKFAMATVSTEKVYHSVDMAKNFITKTAEIKQEQGSN